MRHPSGEYRLAAAEVPAGRFMHVCWSVKSRPPLLIEAQNGQTVWRVTKVDHKPIAAAVFQIRDAGFIRTNANQDIERD